MLAYVLKIIAKGLHEHNNQHTHMICMSRRMILREFGYSRLKVFQISVMRSRKKVTSAQSVLQHVAQKRTRREQDWRHENDGSPSSFTGCVIFLSSRVRPVEEHVEGFGQRRSLPGGRAGQPNRRGLDRPAREVKHAAPHPGSGVHGSVRD